MAGASFAAFTVTRGGVGSLCRTTESAALAATAPLGFQPSGRKRKALQMKRDDLYPAKYFRVADLVTRSLTLKIASTAIEPLNNPQKGQQDKLVLRFHKTNQALVMNLTRYDDVANFLGDETNNWPGHLVELYVGESGGVQCIRCRQPTQRELPGHQANLAARPLETATVVDGDLADEIPF
jgi:hypothetical protein